ncbi:beta-aspartyl-peptidase [Guggenheimella bovis]
MLTIIKNVDVYAPEHLGRRNLLLSEAKIEKITTEEITLTPSEGVQVIDGSDLILTPGFIDLHVHITGGGGERGFASRVKESETREFLEAGTTTVLGLLGTDSITRSLENLLAKSEALNAEGMRSFFLTGSYSYPSKTLTGSVERDLCLIKDCVGCKIAISDHRDSKMTFEELFKLVAEVRLGSMLSGKAGLLTLHLGDEEKKIDDLLKIAEIDKRYVKHFLPTHMGRNTELLTAGLDLIKCGGNIDISTDDDPKALEELLRNVLQIFDPTTFPSLTLSTDAYGSIARFNEEGECIGYTYAKPTGLLSALRILVNLGLPLSEALPFVTKNPAQRLQMKLGEVKEGYLPDLLLFTKDLNLERVIHRGLL